MTFTISPGALVQDLTYFELPTTTKIEMEDLVNFPDYYVVLYTNWRYIETVYDNPLKIEGTLYNPQTRKTITGWSNYTNRIILGVFSYIVEDNEIKFVTEKFDDLYFEDSNVVQNGFFDQRSYKFWTAINSTLRIIDKDGIANTPCLHVTPIADVYQGIGQVLQTKTGYNYEVSFYVRSDELLPFQVLALDGSSLYNMSAPEVARYDFVTSREWTFQSFKFQAISNNTTLLFLKRSDILDDTFDIDSIYCLEYLEVRKKTDINKIKSIDGGLLVASPDDPNPILPPDKPDKPGEDDGEVKIQKWVNWVKEGQAQYSLPDYEKMDYNYDIVFYDSNKLSRKDYSVNFSNGELRLNFPPEDSQAEITTYFIGCSNVSTPLISEWTIVTEEDVHIYRVPSTSPLKEKSNGKYLVFYGADLLFPSDYSIDPRLNTITINSDLNEGDVTLSIYYFETARIKNFHMRQWELDVNDSQQNYFLSGNDTTTDATGAYLVFYDADKLRDDDFSVDNTDFRLKFLPGEVGTKLNILYMGTKGKLPFDGQIFKKWLIGVNANQTQYQLSDFQEAENRSIMVFFDSNMLESSDYYFDPTGSIRLNFQPKNSNSELSIYSAVYTEPNTPVFQSWSFTTRIGTNTYFPPTTSFKDPDFGKYLVFYGSNLLSDVDYELSYSQNSITLSNDLAKTSSELMIFYADSKSIENLEVLEWTLDVEPGQDEYYLDGNEIAKDTDPGFYLVFYGSSKLRDDDFIIRSSTCRLKFSPAAENTLKVFFIGLRDETPAPSADLVFRKWEVRSNRNQQQYLLSGYSEPERNTELVFYDSNLLSPKDYAISTTGRVNLGFVPTNSRSRICVVSVGGNDLSSPIIEKWYLTTIPGQKDYNPTGESLKDPAFGKYLVFYGSSLLQEEDYSVDYKNNKITLKTDISSKAEDLSIFYVNTNVLENLEAREWILNTDKTQNEYILNGNENARDDDLGIYLAFYGSSKLQEEDYSINKELCTINFEPFTEDILRVFYIGLRDSAIVDPTSNALVRRWEIRSNMNQTRYILANYSSSDKSTDLIFYDSNLLSSDDYTINSAGAMNLGFTPTTSTSRMNIFSIGRGDLDQKLMNLWEFDVLPGQQNYTPLDNPFKDPAFGEYLVFYGSSLLDPDDYVIDSSRNRIMISAQLGKIENKLTIYFVESGVNENFTIKSWNLKTAVDRKNYVLDNPVDPEYTGFYLVFYDSNKLRDEDFDIIENNFQLRFDPTQDNTSIRIFFIGEKEDASVE